MVYRYHSVVIKYRFMGERYGVVMRELMVQNTMSDGITVGKAYVISKQDMKADNYQINEQEIESEIMRYYDAVKEARQQLEEIARTNESKVFFGHLAIIKDQSLHDITINRIQNGRRNAQQAIEEAAYELYAQFDAMKDDYIRERKSDISDVCTRIMKCLKKDKRNPFLNIVEPVILVADELTPSDTLMLPLERIIGIITKQGGVTSHVSILAREMEIPALVGVSDIMEAVSTGDMIAMDAEHGIIIIDPDDSTLQEYEKQAIHYQKIRNAEKELDALPSITLDGKSIRVCANVGNVEAVKKAASYHIDGIGLFRSEFLYMENDHFPTEEEQFLAYKEAAMLCEKEIVIRTLDIGGDKALHYYEFEKEENPFLGWRAIRISLELEEVFKTQLRAILRASAYGTIKIMLPMIISVEELNRAKEILNDCKKELKEKGHPFDEKIKIGIMIETPAAVLCAEDLAREADFFSIGTNDLTQYLLAVDRGNPKIKQLFNEFHPAVLRSIQKVINAGHAMGIEVGMCGEMAADERATKLLLGLGLDEFSMSICEMAKIKKQIRSINYKDAVEMAKKMVSAATMEEVMRHL